MSALLILLVALMAKIAIGAEVSTDAVVTLVPTVLPQLPDFWAMLTKPEFLAKVIALAVAAQVIFWGLGETLTRLSVVLDKPGTSKLVKAAQYFSQLAWILGAFCGKFGVGAPKLVIEEKAKELAAKGVDGTAKTDKTSSTGSPPSA